MKGRPWAKFSVGMPRDPKVATLATDGARWAFVAVVLAAKEQDRPGGFENIDHLRAVVSLTVGEHIQELVDRGLLSVDPEGAIRIAAWAKYQIDPTKTERAARYRAKIAEITPTIRPKIRGGSMETPADVIRRLGGE